MNESSMYLVAGLGNPGERYRGTRHNIGFMVANKLVERLGCDSGQAKFSGLVNDCRLTEVRVTILRPQTFMNRSGSSVVQALNWFKLDLENLLVIYDDLDLPFGEVRIRRKGSAAGHNGLSSVMEICGTQEVARLRVGIGRPSRGDTVSYVLSRFNKEEEAELGVVVDHAADAVLAWINGGIDETMGQFNGVNVLAKPE
ncbi:MAG: aminoacyl-tRNA hydrolase [Thermomicrobiaceae bacterium]